MKTKDEARKETRKERRPRVRRRLLDGDVVLLAGLFSHKGPEYAARAILTALRATEGSLRGKRSWSVVAKDMRRIERAVKKAHRKMKKADGRA
jgi:hypothetical protein